MILDGPRLRLRPWREADSEAFAALNADPEVMRHFPAPLTRAESDAFLARIRAHEAAHGFCFWAVEGRGDRDRDGTMPKPRTAIAAPIMGRLCFTSALPVMSCRNLTAAPLVFWR